MNSYPPEFLTHPQPLMFVAGLSDSNGAQTARDRSASVNSAGGPSSRRPSASAGSGSITSGTTSSKVLDPSSAAGSVGLSLKSPVVTPGVTPTVSTAPLPTSPPIPGQVEEEREASPLKSPELSTEDAAVPAAAEASPQDKEFERLLSDLRGALGGLGRRAKVWLPPQQRKDFRIVLVDKNIRLPLRKVASSSSSDIASAPHSPLSPLTTSSPLYPDGLIAPVWVRKHAELVPSVFVLFLRLYETPSLSEEELAAETAEQKAARGKAERAKEQEMDDLLVGEIGDRRRRLGERGIKLTVVLMASTEALDSSNLDPRLSYLRRASALSSKASLFVLTPVPADQLPDFVQSLQDALYDSAMEYYSNHTKRVRRKKARLPANQYGALLGSDRGRALGSQGWGVRYDWKAGWFAEVKGEMDVARRHYEDCWNELARMFASTQTLPPRTKRWAEAKVLADCVAVKICKLLLYEGGGAKVLGPFFVHLKRFGDLSRGWGIGEETFEFWSWIARQYRIFAELLDLAVQAGLQLVTPPTAILTSPDLATSPTLSEPVPPGKTALNPLQILQPPAFYFYMAASCTIQRQRRFLAAQAAEEDALGSEAGAASGYVSAAPGYANEKKVDHAGLIVDLLTKAYTLVKDQTLPQNRVGLYLAFRIAETYSLSGQYELAIRFFERISPNFKLEKWDPIVRQIREIWYEAAQRTGNVESAARMLIEMMCPGSGVEDSERATLQEDLLSVLQTTSPAKSEPIDIEMSGDSMLLSVSAAFWQPEFETPASAPFQITLTCPTSVDMSSISFDHLSFAFSDERQDLIVTTTEDQAPIDRTQIIDVGLRSETESKSASTTLRWAPGSRLVINGQLESRYGPPLSITSATLALKQGSWDIKLRFIPSLVTEWITERGSLVPVHDLSSVVSFISRAYDVVLEVSHHPSAFVDELLPVSVKVVNKDDRYVTGKLSVFLQPAEEEDGATIACGTETSRALLEDLDLGSLAPGRSVQRTIILKSPAPSTKIIDFSLHASGTNESSQTPSDVDHPIQEIIHTAVIPVLPPFEMMSRIDAIPSSKGDAKSWAMVISTVLSCPMPRSITVQKITAIKADVQEGIELVSSSLDNATDHFPQVWDQDTSYAIYSKFEATSFASSSRGLASAPAFLVLSWKSDETEDLTETRLSLPPLDPPVPEGPISARLTPPSVVKLAQPSHLSLELANLHRALSTSIRVEVTTAENFVWRGSRNIRIPDLLPEESKVLKMELIAVGKTGWCALPKISVWEESDNVGGDNQGRDVRIIDARDGGDVGDGLQVFVRP